MAAAGTGRVAALPRRDCHVWSVGREWDAGHRDGYTATFVSLRLVKFFTIAAEEIPPSENNDPTSNSLSRRQETTCVQQNGNPGKGRTQPPAGDIWNCFIYSLHLQILWILLEQRNATILSNLLI